MNPIENESSTRQLRVIAAIILGCSLVLMAIWAYNKSAPAKVETKEGASAPTETPLAQVVPSTETPVSIPENTVSDNLDQRPLAVVLDREDCDIAVTILNETSGDGTVRFQAGSWDETLAVPAQAFTKTGLSGINQPLTVLGQDGQVLAQLEAPAHNCPPPPVGLGTIGGLSVERLDPAQLDPVSGGFM